MYQEESGATEVIPVSNVSAFKLQQPGREVNAVTQNPTKMSLITSAHFTTDLRGPGGGTELKADPVGSPVKTQAASHLIQTLQSGSSMSH